MSKQTLSVWKKKTFMQKWMAPNLTKRVPDPSVQSDIISVINMTKDRFLSVF